MKHTATSQHERPSEPGLTRVVASAQLNVGVVDAEHPPARVAHVGGLLHVHHVGRARPGDVEVALAVAGVETCLGRDGRTAELQIRGRQDPVLGSYLCRDSFQPCQVSSAAGVHACGPSDVIVLEYCEGKLSVCNEHGLESIYLYK